MGAGAPRRRRRRLRAGRIRRLRAGEDRPAPPHRRGARGRRHRAAARGARGPLRRAARAGREPARARARADQARRGRRARRQRPRRAPARHADRARLRRRARAARARCPSAVYESGRSQVSVRVAEEPRRAIRRHPRGRRRACSRPAEPRGWRDIRARAVARFASIGRPLAPQRFASAWRSAPRSPPPSSSARAAAACPATRSRRSASEPITKAALQPLAGRRERLRAADGHRARRPLPVPPNYTACVAAQPQGERRPRRSPRSCEGRVQAAVPVAARPEVIDLPGPRRSGSRARPSTAASR